MAASHFRWSSMAALVFLQDWVHTCVGGCRCRTTPVPTATCTEKCTAAQEMLGVPLNPNDSTPTHWKLQHGFPHWELYSICSFCVGHIFRKGAFLGSREAH